MSLAAPPHMQQPSYASTPSSSAPPRPPAPTAPASGPVPHVHVRRKPSPSVSSPGSVPRPARPARPPLSTSAVYNHAKASSPDAPSLSKQPLTSSSSSFATPPAPESALGDADADASHPSASQGSRRGGIFHRKFNTSTDNISLSSRLSISSTVSSASVMIRRSATSLGAGVTRGRNKISRASKHSIMGISNIFSKDKDKEKEKDESQDLTFRYKIPSPGPPTPTAPTNPVPAASRPAAPSRNFSAPTGSSEFASRAPGAGVSVSHMTIEADAAAATRDGLTPAAFYVRQMQEAEQARALQQQTSNTGDEHISPANGDGSAAGGQTSSGGTERAEKPSWRARMFGDSGEEGHGRSPGPAMASGPSVNANKLSAAESGIRRSSSTRSAKETSDALLRHAAGLQADAAPSAAAARDQAEHKRASQNAEPEERTASSFYDVGPSWSFELPPLQFTDQSLLGSGSGSGPDLEMLQSTTPNERITEPLLAGAPPTATFRPATTIENQSSHHPVGSSTSVVSLGSLGTDSSAPASNLQESDSLSQWAEGIERGRASAARLPTPRGILKKMTGSTNYALTTPGPGAAASTRTVTTLPTSTSNTSTSPLAADPMSPLPGANPNSAPNVSHTPPTAAEARRPKKIIFAPRAQLHTTWAAHIYDRRGELTTANRLTPVLAQQIKEELNAYKMEEMPVAPTSRVFTQFFV